MVVGEDSPGVRTRQDGGREQEASFPKATENPTLRMFEACIWLLRATGGEVGEGDLRSPSESPNRIYQDAGALIPCFV